MKFRVSIIAIALLASTALLVGCESEIDDKPAAEVSDPATQQADQADEQADDESDVEPEELAFDVESSSIGWVGAKVTGDHVGGFEEWTGTLTLAGDQFQGLDFTVDTRSIFSDDDDLTDHLMSDDFFDVENHPEAAFTSSEIVKYDGDDATHRVTGDFTIRGVTQTVTFPVTIEADDDAVRGSTEFTINRFDFDITYKGMPDDLIRDEVLLKIDLVAA